MKIDSIINGIVIDHIVAGKGMEVYRLLDLDSLDCAVAVIKNAFSHKLGKKDIIKIDSLIDIDMDVLGFIAPHATVAFIKNGVPVKKTQIELPERLASAFHCKNPRCISSIEQELPSVFNLTDRENKVYRCMYCEAKANF